MWLNRFANTLLFSRNTQEMFNFIGRCRGMTKASRSRANMSLTVFAWQLPAI